MGGDAGNREGARRWSRRKAEDFTLQEYLRGTLPPLSFEREKHVHLLSGPLLRDWDHLQPVSSQRSSASLQSCLLSVLRDKSGWPSSSFSPLPGNLAGSGSAGMNKLNSWTGHWASRTPPFQGHQGALCYETQSCSLPV